MSEVVVFAPGETEPLSQAAQTAVAEIAARHRSAGGLLLKLVTAAGGQIENRLELMPDAVKNRIEAAAAAALELAYNMAERSHRTGFRGGDRAHLALATLTGAAGGAGGLASSLLELPVTTTVIFRSIQSIAAGHGFDASDPQIKAECLQVFAAGSPLPADDGVNTSFLAARVTVTGPAVQRLIASVAPKLAALFGQKLAAQAVPILGAVTGAGINYTFVDYFQQMAHVRFGLRRLALSNDPVAVAEAFRAAALAARIDQS